ncbi:MAG TPA: glycerophosphodiester phosphodiesterase [Rubrobacteraceae bacterium]|nr:glycerophosphodiester phosphodiesterase [Rubrobacteraceae bacterium]
MDKRRAFIAAIAGGVTALAAVAYLRRGTRTLEEGWPVNFAHRGASALAPENTLEAFRLAVEAGARGLELDVHVTRDGEVVVIHDPTVDRTTDGSGVVAAMTLAEIRHLDAGYRFSPDGGRTFPYRGRGLGVPTLTEVYAEFPDARVNADIKEEQPGAEEAVLGVIRGAAAEERTLIASTDHPVIRRFRRVSGGRIATAASRREIVMFYLLSRLHLETLARPVYAALQVPVEHSGITLVTPRFVKAAHSRGVRVDVWTINEVAEMRRLLDLGVDMLMTDRPEALEDLLAERR